MRSEWATSVGMRVKNRLASLPLSLSLHFHFGIGIFSPSEREKSLARKLAQNPAERGSLPRSLARYIGKCTMQRRQNASLIRTPKPNGIGRERGGTSFYAKFGMGVEGRSRAARLSARTSVDRPPPRSTLNFR